YVPFMTYARSSPAREQLWKVYRQRAHPGNLDVLDRMLARRYELARLLGYESWAAYVTEDKMIGSARAAEEFIERIASAAEVRAIGRFFLDLFPLEGKYKHAAQFTLVSGVRDGALPEGALVCNFPRPSAEPALLEHSEVVTFFHEFGHLLHHLFGGHTRWAGVSGVRTEWDFVEAPSQMLEEWCWDASVLQSFTRHVETGKAIPAALIARMRAADEFGKGLRVRQQMFYAATSLRLHDRDPAGLDTTA